MTRCSWIPAGALALAILGGPTLVHAHGQYLQGISDHVGEELGVPACGLPMVTCGLCHQPLRGDRLENVVVGFPDIDPTDRNGPFYDSLTMTAGWDHLPHADDMNAHRDMNLALLMDVALPVMLGDEIDSDDDGVHDLEELWLGYNPLLAYEADDPMRSQLCGDAEPFPDRMGGETDTTDGAESETDTTSGEEESSTSEDSESSDEIGDMEESTEESTESGETTADTDTGGDGSSAADDESGCGCTAGGGERPLGTMAVFGLLALGLRRRRAKDARG